MAVTGVARAMARRILLHWQLSSVHGWGIYGLNLALAWAGDPGVHAATDYEVHRELIAIDPLQWRVLEPFLSRSESLRAQLVAQPKTGISINAVLIAQLGPDLQPAPGAQDGPLRGEAEIGVAFVEREDLGADAPANLGRFAAIIAGSRWNAELLRAHGARVTHLVLQGIDPALFHPAPRRGLFAGRFVVFSGGKLEARKGQDTVIAAWRIFAACHPDALLVTAWYNPWPKGARDIDAFGRAGKVPTHADATLDVGAWAAANGICPEQFVDIGQVPNSAMPTILREADAAVFPNRCEGGTNLVAMEAMACGVPTILSANTGHLDLLADGAALALTRQRPVPWAPGWHESDVEEIVAALETIYTDRARAAALGAAGARLMAGLTWAKTAAEVKRIACSL